MMSFSRLSGASALCFVVTAVTATAILRLAGLPETDAGPEEVSRFFADQATSVGIASTLAPLAWLLLAVFGAGAAVRIWRVEQPRGEAWSLVGLVGVVMQNVLFAGAVVTQVALLAGAPAGGGLWDLHNAFFTMNGIALATALVGFSIGGRRAGVIRTWHSAVGLLAAALQAASAMTASVTLGGGPAGIGMLGLAGFLLWLVWLIAFGAVLLRDRAPDTVGSRGEPAPAAS